DDVARLLASQYSSRFLHLLKHVLVAYRRAQHGDTCFAQSNFQAHVGHGGGNHRVFGQFTALLEVESQQKHDGIAVDHAACSIGEEGAVGVTIETDAEVGASSNDFPADNLGVQRTAIFVDVAAVGCAVREIRIQPAAAEYLFGYGASCTIGAIDHG